MKPIPEIAQNCDNCVHERDSGHEYCGACSGGSLSNWREDPSSLEARADAEIARLEARIAELEELVKINDAIFDAID